jgi:acyl-coenzyme A synthetase/AMP-(fatty) acid ligase
MVFRFGGTLILEPSFSYPGRVLEILQREQVTGFPGVPTVFSILLNLDLTHVDFSSLRYITNTAAALPTSHIEALRDRFPGVAIYSMYGMTESQRGLYLPPDQISVRPSSVGIPIPGTEAWIEDEEGIRVGPGVVGELVVRGSHVMRGYWGDEEATAQRFRPGPTVGEKVLHSGDLFRTDEDGFFYFVGRQDDIIKSRGEKVAPREVENVLYAFPGVTKAAVVGVDDAVLGKAIKAFLVIAGKAPTAEHVVAHCRQHLEDYMVPHQIEFCESLPETTSGKIAKTGLR